MHFNYVRMLPSVFDDLLSLVGPSLTKQRSRFREPLLPAMRLAVTLCYVATGESQASLSFSVRIGRSTVCQILNAVPEKFGILLVQFQLLFQVHLRNGKGFQNMSRISGALCLGAIDGKHCIIKCPPNSGSTFHTYKEPFSLVLMAVADASYIFAYVDVGDYGRQSDSSVLSYTILGEMLNKGDLNVPQDECLPDMLTKARHCSIGDEAFPLKDTLQKPYPGKNLPEKLRITTTICQEQEG